MTTKRSNFQGTGLPPEKVAQIAPLAAQGRSASQIAKALGTTKGTIIGLTRRLGIQLNGFRPTAAQLAEARAARNPKNSNPTGFNGARAVTPKPPLPPPPPAPVLPSPKSILEVEYRQCRYIGNRPELLTLDTKIYRGAPTDGGPYCPEHHARCSAGRAYR
jgi:hypothetical protein